VVEVDGAVGVVGFNQDKLVRTGRCSNISAGGIPVVVRGVQRNIRSVLRSATLLFVVILLLAHVANGRIFLSSVLSCTSVRTLRTTRVLAIQHIFVRNCDLDQSRNNQVLSCTSKVSPIETRSIT
jgi:hypothetical protein